MITTPFEIGKLDSDSVSPGSNPGSPASHFPLIDNMLEEICNRGNPRIVGKFGHYTPHKSRHSFIRRLERICESGHPRRNNYSDYTQLADIYETTGVRIRLHKVRTEFLKRAVNEKVFHYSNETESHSRLRNIGRAMMVRPLNEFSIGGSRVDIIDQDLKLIIECGNVTVSGIANVLADHSYTYYIIPFQTAADDWFDHGAGRPVYYYSLSLPIESRIMHLYLQDQRALAVANRMRRTLHNH